eukprot:1159288-Pelagomonas_calceolata.AAC.5
MRKKRGCARLASWILLTRGVVVEAGWWQPEALLAAMYPTASVCPSKQCFFDQCLPPGGGHRQACAWLRGHRTHGAAAAGREDARVSYTSWQSPDQDAGHDTMAQDPAAGVAAMLFHWMYALAIFCGWFAVYTGGMLFAHTWHSTSRAFLHVVIRCFSFPCEKPVKLWLQLQASAAGTLPPQDVPPEAYFTQAQREEHARGVDKVTTFPLDGAHLDVPI